MLKPSAVLKLLAACICFASAGVSRGQVLAERVPSDAIVYGGWMGTDILKPSYEASNLKKLFDAFELARQMAQRAERAPAGIDPERAKFQRELMAAFSAAPGALYVGPTDNTGPVPQPRMAFFARVGRDPAADFARRAAEMLRHPVDGEEAPMAIAGSSVDVVAAGDFLLVQSKNIDIRERLAGGVPPENLANQETFKRTLAKLGPAAGRSAVIGYMDGQALWQSAVEAGKELPEVEAFLPMITAATGLSALRQVMWGAGFDGANWQSSGFAAMSDSRKGLLAFIDNKPLAQESLRLIPKNAIEAGAIRFDGMRLLQDLTAAGGDNEEVPKMIDTGLSEIYKLTGINVKRDLLPAMGDEYLYYAVPDATGATARGFTLVNRLRNADRAKVALENMENFVNLLILQRNPDSKVQFAAQPLPAPFQQVQAHVMTIDRLTPSWAIVDGVFYFSMTQEGLVAALRQAKEPDSILDNPTFARLKDRLSPAALSSFDYVDIPVIVPEFRDAFERQLEQARLMGAPMPEVKMPPVDTLRAAASPRLSVRWSDADGFHSRSTEPFPFSTYVRPSQLMMMMLSERFRPAARELPGPASLPAQP